MELLVNHRIIDGVAVLSVVGELDISTSPKVRSAIEDLIGEGHSAIVINLLQTIYLDSTGLSVLSSALTQARAAGGNLGLVYDQPQVAKIFMITGLHEILPVFRSELEALAAAKAWLAGPRNDRPVSR